MKTKHLKQKAEKKAAQKKLTHKMKIDRALKRQESLKSLKSRCAYSFKHLREVNAADHEFVVRIKKLESEDTSKNNL